MPWESLRALQIKKRWICCHLLRFSLFWIENNARMKSKQHVNELLFFWFDFVFFEFVDQIDPGALVRIERKKPFSEWRLDWDASMLLNFVCGSCENETLCGDCAVNDHARRCLNDKSIWRECSSSSIHSESVHTFCSIAIHYSNNTHNSIPSNQIQSNSMLAHFNEIRIEIDDFCEWGNHCATMNTAISWKIS